VSISSLAMLPPGHNKFCLLVYWISDAYIPTSCICILVLELEKEKSKVLLASDELFLVTCILFIFSSHSRAQSDTAHAVARISRWTY
jgi:hypothetical protein